MTAPTPAGAARRGTDPARRLAEVTDVDLGVRLLRGTPTNEGRDDTTLRAVSIAAQQFGADLARSAPDSPGRSVPGGARAHRPVVVVERSGGLRPDAPVVARYLPRRSRVELFTDAVAHCEAVIARLGWRSWFPEGSVRAAALLHEEAHALVAHTCAADLRRAVGVPALRLGRWTRWAHVAGADELAAHAYAQARLGLPRSPLLVTAAAMAAIDRRDLAPAPSVEED